MKRCNRQRCIVGVYRLSGEAQKLGVAIFQHQLEHFQPLESLTSAVVPRDHEKGFRGSPILLRFGEFIPSHARSRVTSLRSVAEDGAEERVLPDTIVLYRVHFQLSPSEGAQTIKPPCAWSTSSPRKGKEQLVVEHTAARAPHPHQDHLRSALRTTDRQITKVFCIGR